MNAQTSSVLYTPQKSALYLHCSTLQPTVLIWHSHFLCVLIYRFSRDVIGNEDNCLSLNVYTRALPDSSKSNMAEKNGLPVIVWIHGGGFNLGGYPLVTLFFYCLFVSTGCQITAAAKAIGHTWQRKTVYPSMSGFTVVVLTVGDIH